MAETIEVLLFGPKLPVAGEKVTCTVHETSFSLPMEKYGKAVSFNQLKAEVGGFDHDQLQLHWSSGDAEYMVVAIDKAGQKLLTQHLPAGQVEGQQQWKVTTASQSMVWKSIWYSFAALALLVVIGILQYDRLLSFAANQISVKTEVRLGNAALKAHVAEGRMLKKGAAVDFVRTIGDQLTKGSKYQYQWIVVKDPLVNAFALPGGIVAVNTGLLQKADSANEVAAVIAHEIQHVEQKHSLKNLLNRASMAAVFLVVLGDANAALIWITDQISSQFFSRQVEKEADEKGRELLLKNRISANGMASFFKKLQALRQGKKAPSWMSSHPDTEDRIAMTKKFIKAHPCKDCKALTWDKPLVIKSIGLEKAEKQPAS